MMAAEEETLDQHHGEFPDKDKKMAEASLAYRAALVEAEDRTNQLPQLLKPFTEELQRELGPNLLLVTLYGSHARGQAGPDSDVDILVVLRRPSRSLGEKVRQVAYKWMWETDFAYVLSLYLTDVRHYKTLEQHGSSFLRNIQREGKVLWKAA